MEVFVQMNRNKNAEGQSYELLGASEKFRPFASVGHYECREPWVLHTQQFQNRQSKVWQIQHSTALNL